MTEIHSFQPLLDNTTELTRFRGTYFLTEFESRIGDEQHYWKLALADSSGELTVYCYDPEFIQDHIAAGMYVQVEVVRKSTRGCEFVQCVQLHSWEREQEKRLSLMQLPRCMCPKPQALDWFLDFRNRIRVQNLRRFLDRVIMQPHVSMAFLTAPGSLEEHFSHPGGLIEHSVATAWSVIGYQDHSFVERDLAIVAALLHDIGKTQTMTSDLVRTRLGRLVNHNHLTLEICADALAEMDLLAPGLGDQLRHAWTSAETDSECCEPEQSQLAERLEECDLNSFSEHVVFP